MLKMMETAFLRDNQFLCGNEISIADLMAICELMQPIVCGEDVYKGHPKLAAWHERVKAKLQPEFDSAHEAIMRFGDRFSKNQSKM
jgi:glutathione S-transferase